MSDRVVTWQEFRKHTLPHDCWVMIDEEVYNVTDYMVEHPGGDDILVKYPTSHSGTAALTAPSASKR